jgi:hypothetical protein
LQHGFSEGPQRGAVGHAAVWIFGSPEYDLHVGAESRSLAALTEQHRV